MCSHSLKKLISQNYYLSESAKDGYHSYLQAYASHSLRTIFDVRKLDLVKVVGSFGFATPPRVDLTLGASMGWDKKTRGRRAYGSQPKARWKFQKEGKLLSRLLADDVYLNEESKMQYHKSFVVDFRSFLYSVCYNDCLIYTVDCVSLQLSLPRKYMTSLRMFYNTNNLMGIPKLALLSLNSLIHKISANTFGCS